MVFTLSALFSSCVMYHPQSVDIPLIRHQNDLQVEGAISSTLFGSPAINATATYSFNKWGAVQAHINTDGYTEFYLQTAFGSYLPIKQHYVIEGYTGYGFGFSKTTTSLFGKDITISGIYHCPFLQFNTGWVGLAKEHIDVGFGLKTGCFITSFSKIQTNIKGNETSPETQVSTFKEIVPLIEPQIFIRFGGKKLKGSLRVGYCTFFNMGNFDYSPINVSLGMTYKFEFKR